MGTPIYEGEPTPPSKVPPAVMIVFVVCVTLLCLCGMAVGGLVLLAQVSPPMAPVPAVSR